MASFAEADGCGTTTAGFSSYSEGSVVTLDMATGRPRLRGYGNSSFEGDDSGPGTPPIIIWSSPSPLGSPWSPQGDIVPEPSLTWQEYMDEVHKILDEEARAKQNANCESVTKAESNPKSKATTKSKKGKKTNENKKNNNGKETKEKNRPRLKSIKSARLVHNLAAAARGRG